MGKLRSTDLKLLRGILKPTAIVESSQQYDRNYVFLSDPQEQESQVKIVGLPEDSVIFKADKFPNPTAILSGKKGECCRADFVIFGWENGRARVIYIEMKKVKDDQTHVVNQLKGAACVTHYIKEIARQFHMAPTDFLDEFKPRFVSIARTGSIRKKPSRYDRGETHDQPERLMKIDWPGRVEYGRLAT